MKISNFAFLTPALFVAVSTSARVTSENVEVPVARVFIPAQGFDDNDTIEAVLDGELPNGCYSLERQTVEIDRDKKEVRIRQFATHQTDGICAPDGAGGNVSATTPVPFTDTVALGQLNAGDYRIVFMVAPEKTQTRAFSVVAAPTSSVDSRPYASVTQVATADVSLLGENSSIVVNGILNSSCYEFNDNVQVSVIDDVIIVMPTVEITGSASCLQYVRPFSHQVDLGKLPAKRYLVHVRSMHGKSVNRVFSVRKQDDILR